MLQSTVLDQRPMWTITLRQCKGQVPQPSITLLCQTGEGSASGGGGQPVGGPPWWHCDSIRLFWLTVTLGRKTLAFLCWGGGRLQSSFFFPQVRIAAHFGFSISGKGSVFGCGNLQEGESPVGHTVEFSFDQLHCPRHQTIEKYQGKRMKNSGNTNTRQLGSVHGETDALYVANSESQLEIEFGGIQNAHVCTLSFRERAAGDGSNLLSRNKCGPIFTSFRIWPAQMFSRHWTFGFRTFTLLSDSAQ